MEHEHRWEVDGRGNERLNCSCGWLGEWQPIFAPVEGGATTSDASTRAFDQHKAEVKP